MSGLNFMQMGLAILSTEAASDSYRSAYFCMREFTQIDDVGSGTVIRR